VTEDPCPAVVLAPAPCPRCGATTDREAETLCKPTLEACDEWTCPGESSDEEGRLVQPTPESLAAIDAWVDRHAPRELSP
jgi:hypothetical protein